jgi:hypothetical protein
LEGEFRVNGVIMTLALKKKEKNKHMIEKKIKTR